MSQLSGTPVLALVRLLHLWRRCGLGWSGCGGGRLWCSELPLVVWMVASEGIKDLRAEEVAGTKQGGATEPGLVGGKSEGNRTPGGAAFGQVGEQPTGAGLDLGAGTIVFRGRTIAEPNAAVSGGHEVDAEGSRMGAEIGFEKLKAARVILLRVEADLDGAHTEDGASKGDDVAGAAHIVIGDGGAVGRCACVDDG